MTQVHGPCTHVGGRVEYKRLAVVSPVTGAIRGVRQLMEDFALSAFHIRNFFLNLFVR